MFRPGYARGPQDMLGAAQWAWLENELRTRTADVTLIGSGLQVLADGKIVAEVRGFAGRLVFLLSSRVLTSINPYLQNYAKFPASQAKLLALVVATATPNVLFLSGDVHLAELSRLACVGSPLARDFYDLTSSGMTHAWNTALKHYAVALSVPPHRAVQRFTGFNIGLVDVAWGNASTHTVHLRVVGATGDLVLDHTLAFPALADAAAVAPLQAAAHDTTVQACAAANVDAGMPAACAALLQACAPHFTVLEVAHMVGGTLTVASLVLLIGAAVAGTPVYLLLLLRRPWPATARLPKRVAWPLLVVAYAAAVKLLEQQMTVT